MIRRFEYIDIAKGIGILLVVWAHILLSGASHKVIYAFHMPLFFLISGMLFRRTKYNTFRDFLIKRAKRLLIPFVLYSIITWLIWAIFRFVRHDAVVSYWDPLLQTIIAKGSGTYMVHNSALWFIPCLFATEIIYFAFSKFNDATKLIISAGCAALSFALGHYFADDWWFLLPWNLDAALIAVLFYCIGNIFSIHLSNIKIIEYTKSHTKIMLWLLVVLSIVLYWSAMEFGECSMGSSSYQCNGVIFIIRAIIGIAACILLSVFIGFLSSENILKKYLIREGKSSLDIMSIHIPIKGIVIMGLAILIHQTGDYISNNVLYSICAFIITMAVVDLLVNLITKGKHMHKPHIDSQEKNILLFGIDGTQTLPIAKSLYKKGYHLIGTFHDKLSYGANTRYIHEKIKLVCAGEKALVDELIKIIKEKDVAVIIPFGDSSAELLSKYKDELGDSVKLSIPDYDIFMSAYDKNKLMSLCQANNYPHPITLDLSKQPDKADLKDFPYPALIKPNITTGGRGMTLVNSYEEYWNKIEGIKAKYGDCHLQQFIPEGGRQIKVQIFVDKKNDRNIGSVIWKQRYYPEKGGSSCCNITIDAPDLIQLCSSVLHNLSWEGFADFDLIEDPRDSQLKIMEINPRFPACLKSATESGIDYANILVDYTLGNPLKNYEYKPGAKLRHIGFECLWFISSKNRFKTKPNWFNWITPRLYFQDFSITDPLPFVFGTWGNIKKLFGTNLIKEKSGI